MVFNPQSSTTDTSGKDHLNEVIIARVIDILLDGDSDEAEMFDEHDCVGMILYREVNDSLDSSESGEEVYTGKAYPLNPNFNTYPLKNEIVYIVKGPDSNLKDGGKSDKDYYLSIISIWNHPHINLYPVKDDTQPDAVNVGEGMDFLSDIAPIQPYPGDTILQGKLGTSIRLSGGHSDKNPFKTNENKNKPFMIFSNGITNNNPDKNGFQFINENVDKDPSSLYLTSNHIIPITLANSKRDSYDDKPEATNKFKGSMFLGNADRIVLNAKNDDILLSSARSIGMNSNTLNLDSKDYLCLDADKIYLGKIARTRDGAAKQPVMLGHEVEAFLQNLIDAVNILAQAMSKAKGDRKGPLGAIINGGIKGQSVLGQLKNTLNPSGTSNLKSKKTFVE